MSRSSGRWIVACLLGAGLVAQGCTRGADDKPGAPAEQRGGGAPAASGSSPGGAGGGAPGAGRRPLQYPVEVVPVESRTVEFNIVAVGSVEAFERVQVTARVPGVVESVRFAEGDTVKDGQVLVEIEPQRYRLAVEQARARQQQTEVERTDAEQGLKRRESLKKTEAGMIREEEIETWRTKVGVAKAEFEQERSALQMAELNLRDALVPAPVAGIIQTRNVQTGQYVQAGTTLATLVRREPLLLRFQVPEKDAARLRPPMKATFTVRDGTRPYTAVLTHVADFASPETRLVPVTARVDDPQREQLRPGTFAEVSVSVGSAADVPVISQTAVRPSERGFLAYVIEGEVARERVLGLGLRTLDGQVEIRSGLQPGELLVVRGAEALREGSPVRVVEAPAAAASPAATPAPAAAAAAEVGR